MLRYMFSDQGIILVIFISEFYFFDRNKIGLYCSNVYLSFWKSLILISDPEGENVQKFSSVNTYTDLNTLCQKDGK